MPQVRERIRKLVLPPFDPLNAQAAQLRGEGHDVISLGQAVPYFPPPPAAVQAAREALEQLEINRYVTASGLPGLRQALAGRLSTRRRAAGTSCAKPCGGSAASSPEPDARWPCDQKHGRLTFAHLAAANGAHA